MHSMLRMAAGSFIAISSRRYLITTVGRPRVLDFGVAKLLHPELFDGGSLTVPGSAYAPAGSNVPGAGARRGLDVRTDLFSFGAVLHRDVHRQAGVFRKNECTDIRSGFSIRLRLPRRGERRDPLAPGGDFSKALEKDREVRYQTAADIRADLKRLRRGRVEYQCRGPSGEVDAACTQASASFEEVAMDVDRGEYSRCTCAAGIWFFAFHSSRKSVVSTGRIVPFTSFPGHETDPAFSPDGNSIAFAWMETAAESSGVYVQVRSVKPRRCG